MNTIRNIFITATEVLAMIATALLIAGLAFLLTGCYLIDGLKGPGS